MKKNSVYHEPQVVVKQVSFVTRSGPHPAWDNDPLECDVAYLLDVRRNIVAIPCWSESYLDHESGMWKRSLRPMNVEETHFQPLTCQVTGERYRELVEVTNWPAKAEATVLDCQGCHVRIRVEPCFGAHRDFYAETRFFFESVAITGAYQTASSGFQGMLHSYHGWPLHFRSPKGLRAADQSAEDVEQFATIQKPEYEDASWPEDEEPTVVKFGDCCMEFRRIPDAEANDLHFARSIWWDR